MLNFYDIVDQVLLTEDPDEAYFRGKGEVLDVSWMDDEAQAFLYSNRILLSTGNHEALFISTIPSEMHSTLEANIRNRAMDTFRTDPITQNLVRKRKIWDHGFDDGEDNSGEGVIAGRIWTFEKENLLLISMWDFGGPARIKKFISRYINELNYSGMKYVYVQPPNAEDDKWVTITKYLGKNIAPQVSNPEVEAILKELKKLTPQLHLTTGPVKDKIRKKINELRTKYKQLTGEEAGEYDLRGSMKYTQQAGDKTPAEVRSLSQTSESKQ